MNTKVLTQLSTKRIDNQTIQTDYEMGNIHYTVKSRFCGSKELSEVTYQMIIKSEQSKPLFIG